MMDFDVEGMAQEIRDHASPAERLALNLFRMVDDDSLSNEDISRALKKLMLASRVAAMSALDRIAVEAIDNPQSKFPSPFLTDLRKLAAGGASTKQVQLAILKRAANMNRFMACDWIVGEGDLSSTHDADQYGSTLLNAIGAVAGITLQRDHPEVATEVLEMLSSKSASYLRHLSRPLDECPEEFKELPNDEQDS